MWLLNATPLVPLSSRHRHTRFQADVTIIVFDTGATSESTICQTVSLYRQHANTGPPRYNDTKSKSLKCFNILSASTKFRPT